MAQATTLSSVGTSAVIQLNPVAKSTTVILSVSATSSANCLIQASVDDPTIPGGTTTQTWAAISSAISSSAAEGIGVVYTVLSPIAALRISSTAITTTTLTMKALQSVTA